MTWDFAYGGFNEKTYSEISQYLARNLDMSEGSDGTSRHSSDLNLREVILCRPTRESMGMVLFRNIYLEVVGDIKEIIGVEIIRRRRERMEARR